MKTCLSITDIFARHVGKPLIAQLAAIYPNGSRDGFDFRAVLPETDPRIPLIFNELHRAGLQREPTGKWNAYKPGKEYSVFKTLSYEDVDFDQVRYISLRPDFRPRFDEENTDIAEPIARLLSLDEPLGSLLFASTNFDHLLATGLGREAIERAGFAGASFIPAYILHPDTDNINTLRKQIEAGSIPDLGKPPLWEIRPILALPAMIPLKYTHRVNGEDRLSRNPIDVDRRMAYAKADLDRVGPFDFARPDPSEDPTKALVDPYVVSQRVFQLMKKQKGFKIDQWTPVREE